MNVSTCPNWQLQRSIYFMCKFTWTWVPAPTDSYSEASTSCASSHEREYLPQPTATAKHLLHVQVHTNLSTCPNRQPQRSIYFMCKFTWTWIQAPIDSYSVASTSCASSHEREYMPHPTPHPNPTKGHGRLRAVVQLLTGVGHSLSLSRAEISQTGTYRTRRQEKNRPKIHAKVYRTRQEQTYSRLRIHFQLVGFNMTYLTLA